MPPWSLVFFFPPGPAMKHPVKGPGYGVSSLRATKGSKGCSSHHRGVTRFSKKESLERRDIRTTVQTTENPAGWKQTLTNVDEVQTFAQTEFEVENEWEARVQNSVRLLRYGTEEDLRLKSIVAPQITAFLQFKQFAGRRRIFEAVTQEGRLGDYLVQNVTPKSIEVVSLLDWREILLSGIKLTDAQVEEIVMLKLIDAGFGAVPRDHAKCKLPGCWKEARGGCPDSYTLLDFDRTTNTMLLEAQVYLYPGTTSEFMSMTVEIQGVDEYFLRWAFRDDADTSQFILSNAVDHANNEVRQKRRRLKETEVAKTLGLRATLASDV